MIHEKYREHLNAGIDEKCLILLGKVYRLVITIGTKDISSTGKRSIKIGVMVNTIWEILLYKGIRRERKTAIATILYIAVQ